LKIKDLINNAEFCFNFRFRIVEYVGTKEEPDKTVLVYDGESEEEIPDDIQNRWISAINTGDDGVMEIEFVKLIGED